ncbi:MAG TPA: hypothetical protein VG737_06255 [Cyclobacteriaceae bacterium]|nr:hypothetical protein [Cyclobacteriaceae bacterium]
MRLGQLARKLAVKQSDLVDFLALNNIHIESGGNTKIEEQHLTLLIEKFAPAGFALSPSEIAEPESSAEPEKQPEPQPTADLQINPEKEITGIEDQKIELIKAPKIELSGLKVLGKIELPEPRKKESTAEDPETPERPERKPRREFRDHAGKDRNQSRSGKNPIAAERERQAREAENKKRERAALEKEKKTLRYMKKMNAVQPTKAVRTFHEPEETVQSAPTPRPEPKTAWGRFLRWLNT